MSRNVTQVLVFINLYLTKKQKDKSVVQTVTVNLVIKTIC